MLPTRAVPILLAALLFVALAPASAATLDGRWRLVAQAQGEGDPGPPPEPLEIELAREGARLTGWSHVGSAGARRSVAWPSLSAAGAQRPATVLELQVGPAGDEVRARYRADADGGGAEPLEIVEEYRVVEGGRALTGTVTVSVPGGGSYVLRRRFERIP